MNANTLMAMRARQEDWCVVMGYRLFNVRVFPSCQALVGTQVTTGGSAGDSAASVVPAMCQWSEHEGGKNKNPEPAGLTMSKERLSISLQCSAARSSLQMSRMSVHRAAQTRYKLASLAVTNRNKLGSKPSRAQRKHHVEQDVSRKKDVPPGAQWSLQLKDSQLPLSDKELFVGRQKQNQDDDAKCTLSVKVEAPPSTVKENAVSCAYGHPSNPSPVKVELAQPIQSEDSNSQ
ncbi:SAG-related sequence [Besnoitia besnoiti]|uniref:SAG-related sequence n=1 Tax=Besnoitia besnoiti TaxID=94643 RepID=A0A2A9MMS2_BESBE|nr:SAG-related sequence [Besnoitia besnoiti]PFH37761.1 SAG-related sequence [Besnoitia besnoiti]